MSKIATSEWTCENCRAIDRGWRIAPGAEADLTFRRQRRALFHVTHCMTTAERAAWLKAGGMNLIRKLGQGQLA